MNARLSWVIVDCDDPERLATFWGQLLERTVTWRRGPYVFLDGEGAGLGFQRVAEPRQGKNRVHVDLNADDPHAVAARVVELGGSRAPGYEAGGFLVMADPEGNEFCVLPEQGIELDEDGVATYPT